MGVMHIIGLLMLVGATVLLIIVSVGTPIWDAIYFLEARIVGSDALIKLGQWGACVGDTCTQAKLGYNLDFITDAFPDNEVNLSETVVRGLTYALVVNPIAAGFSLLALFAAIFPNTFCGVLGSILSFWAFLVTLVALGLDLGLALTARHRLNDTGRVNASLGKAIWFVVAAAGALLIASVTVCFTTSSRKRKNRRDIETRGLTTGEQTTRRNWMGRKIAAQPYQADPYNTNATGPVMMDNSATHTAPKRHFWQKKQTTTY